MKNYKLKPWLQKTLEIITCICLIFLMCAVPSEICARSLIIEITIIIIALLNAIILNRYGTYEE